MYFQLFVYYVSPLLECNLHEDKDFVHLVHCSVPVSRTVPGLRRLSVNIWMMDGWMDKYTHLSPLLGWGLHTCSLILCPQGLPWGLIGLTGLAH